MARGKGASSPKLLLFSLMPFVKINEMNNQTNILRKSRKRNSCNFLTGWKLTVKRLKSHRMALSFSSRFISSLWNFINFIYWSVSNYCRVHIACDKKWARALRRRGMNRFQMNQSSVVCACQLHFIAETRSFFPPHLCHHAKWILRRDLMWIQGGMRQRDIEVVATQIATSAIYCSGSLGQTIGVTLRLSAASHQ